jgi:hypothetical protein
VIVPELEPISLLDLQAEAAFLTRRDRKYLIPVEALESLLDGINPATRVLEVDGLRCFGYRSLYFDDSAFSAYLLAARRRPHRFKVRTRLYTDSGICQLEVKVHNARGHTVKHRVEHDAHALANLSDPERQWLKSFHQVASHADGMRHCITTVYQRTTLVLPVGAGRVTIDRDLTFSLPNGTTLQSSRWAVIESKGIGGPTTLDRLLWRNGYRPVSMSKFACGLSLLVPELPANRWRRVRNQLRAAEAEE